MNRSLSSAAKLHKKVPPDWYHASIQRNFLQRWWHFSRFTKVKEHSERVGGKMLDIGCADGTFTKEILDRTDAKEIIGLDVLASSVNWAKRHWKKEKRLKFQVGNAHKLNFKANTFEAVYILEVMEHVPDPDQVLKEAHRVLKKGGYIILLVPSDNLLFRIVWWIVTKFWWAKIWEDCHVQSFDAKNPLSKHAKNAGFKVEVDEKFWLGMLNIVKGRKL